MSHHQFGEIAGDEATGGIVGHPVLLDDYSSVAVDTLQQGEALPVIALALNGRLSKSDDTLGAVFVFGVLDAGALVKFIHDAVERLDSDEARADFKVGLAGGA